MHTSLKTHWKKTAVASVTAVLLGAGSVMAYSQNAANNDSSCCHRGAPCCHAGSPCCARMHRAKQR